MTANRLLFVLAVSAAVAAIFLPSACKDRNHDNDAANLLLMQGARQNAEQPTNTTITVEDNNGVSEYGIKDVKLTYGDVGTAEDTKPPAVNLALHLDQEASTKLTANLNRVEPIGQGKYRVQFAGRNAITEGESNVLTFTQGTETFSVNNGCTAEAGLDSAKKIFDVTLESCELKSDSGKTANVDANIHINGADYPGPTSSPGTSARSIQTKRSLGCGGDDQSDLEEFLRWLLGCLIWERIETYPGGCHNSSGVCNDAYLERNKCSGELRYACNENPMEITICGTPVVHR